MSWVGNGRENVFPWLLQDRGKQPGSGNPLSKARGKKKGDQLGSGRHANRAIGGHGGELERQGHGYEMLAAAYPSNPEAPKRICPVPSSPIILVDGY